MELSFYTCKLQLLREELNELNSSVLVYQTVGCVYILKPLNAKETVTLVTDGGSICVVH